PPAYRAPAWTVTESCWAVTPLVQPRIRTSNEADTRRDWRLFPDPIGSSSSSFHFSRANTPIVRAVVTAVLFGYRRCASAPRLLPRGRKNRPSRSHRCTSDPYHPNDVGDDDQSHNERRNRPDVLLDRAVALPQDPSGKREQA